VPNKRLIAESDAYIADIVKVNDFLYKAGVYYEYTFKLYSEYYTINI
jgi:hypothetical protein